MDTCTSIEAPGATSDLFLGKTGNYKNIYDNLSRFGPYGAEVWHVPAILYDDGLREDKVRALQGYFDAEGCPFYGVKRGDRRVEVGSKNKKGLMQVQDLLFSLDISSKLYRDRSWWKLRVSGRENIQKFRDLINFTIKRKETRLEEIIRSYSVI